MSLTLNTPARDAEISVRTIAWLVRNHGQGVTLGDLHNRTDVELIRGGITRRGLKELREVIEYAKAQGNPPVGGSNVSPPATATLRDQFAMAALTGLLAAHPQQVHQHAEAAELAYLTADAMLEERGI